MRIPESAYLADILAQPVTLHTALERFNPADLAELRSRLLAGEFDRIVISGMGSSYQAAYPAVFQLEVLPIPVILVNAAELLHYRRGMISRRTLLWLNSQSGRSVELVRLVEQIQAFPPAELLVCVNDLTSPLAEAAGVLLPIHAGDEHSVSTKTYLNMLAVNLLAARTLAGGDVAQAVAELRAAASAIQLYLLDWAPRLAELDAALGKPGELVILGRGTSLAAVWNGSLICKEAARYAVEGLNAADFRHGPLEMVGPGFCALILAGDPRTRQLNRDLAVEIAGYGGHVLWLDSDEMPAKEAGGAVGFFQHPEAGDFVRPLVEIIPLQLLSLVLAARKGLEAGRFRHVGKVTTRE